MASKDFVWVENIPVEDYKSGKIKIIDGTIGDAKAANGYTVEDFKNAGFLGVYKREGSDDFIMMGKPSKNYSSIAKIQPVRS